MPNVILALVTPYGPILDRRCCKPPKAAVEASTARDVRYRCTHPEACNVGQAYEMRSFFRVIKSNGRLYGKQEDQKCEGN
jgi:hypothetical protein